MVYICIPAYNEERTIGVVLWKIRQVMGELDREYQVLVIDDASTDGTSEVMEPYARIMPVHVRRHARREGYAASLEALIRAAARRAEYPKRDVIVTMQADFTDEPDDVATLVKRIEGGADIVTGHVHLVDEETPRLVRWSRSVWHHVLRRAHRGRIDGDFLSGFRAYRVMAVRKAIEAVEGGRLLTTDGWAANAELLRRVAPHARRMEAVDVQVRYGRRQRESRFRPLQASRELARLLFPGLGPVPVPLPQTTGAAGPIGAGDAEETGEALAASGGSRGGSDGRRRRGRGRRGRGGRGRAKDAAPDSA